MKRSCVSQINVFVELEALTKKVNFSCRRSEIDGVKNKLAVKLFEQWKSQLDIVEDLDVPLNEMKAGSMNFWLGKFVQEVRDQRKDVISNNCCTEATFGQERADRNKYAEQD